tara:strand:+ start:500 stop:1300 length:801 start_codon:yes stop_codon:yes gene_type:complete
MITKKYLIIGNPVSHSLSPLIHNYWFQKYKLDAVYEKKEVKENELKNIIKNIKDEKIFGANVTVPFKQTIIPYLDELSELSNKTQSVNTIYKKNNLIIGDNTDMYGFAQSILKQNYHLQDKKALILGAGGVVPSIIEALEYLSVKKIFIMNRTIEKVEKIKKIYPNIKTLKWGEIENFDIIINATSVGLKKDDKLDMDFSKFKGKNFFYDTIYNPAITDFIKRAKINNCFYTNGLFMLIYQAQKSFEYWNDILPEVDDKLIQLLKK